MGCLPSYPNNNNDGFLPIQHLSATSCLREDVLPQARHDLRVLKVLSCFKSGQVHSDSGVHTDWTNKVVHQCYC